MGKYAVGEWYIFRHWYARLVDCYPGDGELVSEELNLTCRWVHEQITLITWLRQN